MGGDDLLPSDLLVGAIGVRIVNMIMTPAMFARLEAVSSDVLSTARNIYAWDGLEIHLEDHDVRHWALYRMLRTWKQAKALYLDAAYLNVPVNANLYTAAIPDQRCPIAATWRFPITDLDSSSDLETEEHDGLLEILHLSSAEFCVGQEVFFDMILPTGNMPSFDVGWTCDDGDIWSHLCFRVVPHDEPLVFSEGDRARYYAGRPMTEDPAIRVPSSWTSTSPSRLVIGLIFTHTSMTLCINDRRWDAEIEPQFRWRWSRRTYRRAILVLTDEDPEGSLPDIEPHPWYISG